MGCRYDKKNKKEELVLDTIERFDGLERLIVIAVALDAPLDQRTEYMLETRWRLYRGLTLNYLKTMPNVPAPPGGCDLRPPTLAPTPP